jgi:hypothetical protein
MDDKNIMRIVLGTLFCCLFVLGRRSIGLSQKEFFDVDQERLLIRFGKDGDFESWYIYGIKDRPRIVGEKAASNYRVHRAQT